MSEPFLGEIRMVAFNFAPRGWAFCDGQILPINQNQSLYSLFGTTYGGDGRTSYALPDLRGRLALHKGTEGGNSYNLGHKAGEEGHVLPQSAGEKFGHPMAVIKRRAESSDPTGKRLGVARDDSYGHENSGSLVKTAGSVTTWIHGSTVPHNNMMPCLAINFCVALQGLFPSRN